MKAIILLLAIILFSLASSNAQYNNLKIPDTLSGTSFNLTVQDTFKQIRSGNQTITGGINSDFWGPTIFVNKGDTVHMNVRNKLNDSTTIHWHGMHLPAVMDGGPHQIIPPGTLWQPYWKVTNNAGTYWFHPHLHEMTVKHITKGIGGLLIVRDPEEAALNLPRTYGVDDIPIVLTSRRYNTNNQFVDQNTAYGDYLLTNGTSNAQISLPKQYVRLRILNAEIERAYNIGFSDNRNFYIIANDGGLVNTPIQVNRVKLYVGERIEILINLSGDAVGSSLDLKAYNANQPFGFPGGEPNQSGNVGSLLNNLDFSLLHINIANPTNNPITTVPSILANNIYWTANDAKVSRTLNITDGQPGTNFTFDKVSFIFNNINKTVNLNDIEKWTIVNNNVFSHAFHIHDVEFKIVDRNGNANAVGAYESGWKDVVQVPKGESVSFVAKFDDFADPIHPFMYHCHFGNHEDGGMMGQFVVTEPQATLSVSASSITIPETANSIMSFDITSNTSWTATSSQSWLTLSKTNGNGNSNIVITVTATPNNYVRYATITVSATNATNQTIYITQNPGSSTMYLSTTFINFEYPKSSKSIDVVSESKWSAVCSATWLHVNPTSGSSIMQVYISADTNKSIDARSGYIEFSALGAMSQTVTVTQKGIALMLDVTDKVLNMAAPANSSATFGIITNTDWIVQNNSDWLKIENSNGIGNSVVKLIAQENNTKAIRTTDVEISGTKVSNKTISVKQEYVTTGINEEKNSDNDYSLFPNPADDKLYVKLDNISTEVYYITIVNANGKAVIMLPQPEIQKGIDISFLAKGTYFVQLMDKKTKSLTNRKFIKK